jgi:hypothetical protein
MKTEQMHIRMTGEEMERLREIVKGYGGITKWVLRKMEEECVSRRGEAAGCEQGGGEKV